MFYHILSINVFYSCFGILIFRLFSQGVKSLKRKFSDFCKDVSISAMVLLIQRPFCFFILMQWPFCLYVFFGCLILLFL
jgi:hypothetical protein